MNDATKQTIKAIPTTRERWNAVNPDTCPWTDIFSLIAAVEDMTGLLRRIVEARTNVWKEKDDHIVWGQFVNRMHAAIDEAAELLDGLEVDDG